MYLKIKHGMNLCLEFLAGISMVVLVLDVSWQVITRFVMKSPSSWTEELATFLMIWVSLLGASVALNRGAHLGIDYFVQKLPAVAGMYVRILVFLLVAGFSITVLCMGGTELVQITLMRGQMSPALGIPMGYVYIAVPLSGFFLSWYSLEFTVLSVIELRRHKPAEAAS